MADAITITNGKAEMIFAGEMPWHRLGTKIDPNTMTAKQGIIEAGMDWDVVQTNVQGHDGRELGNWAKEMRRSDNGKTLGVVGPNTHILQNSEAFEFFNPWLEAKEAFLETAGSLKGGQVVWVMALIKDAPMEITKGDEVLKYILLSNSHNGKQAVRAGFTPTRVVCANTLAIAHNSADSKLIRLKHSKDVKKNLDAVQGVMNLARKSFEATEQQYKYLASKDINEADLKKYIKILLKKEDEDEAEMHGKTTKMINKITDYYYKETANVAAELLRQYEADAGAKILENMEAAPGAVGNWWGAFNAVTAYTSHDSGKGENRQNSVWFGPNATLNSKALVLAMEMADKK